MHYIILYIYALYNNHSFLAACLALVVSSYYFLALNKTCLLNKIIKAEATFIAPCKTSPKHQKYYNIISSNPSASNNTAAI